MLKYVAIMAVVLGFSVYVASHDKGSAKKSAQEAARLRGETPSAIANEKPSQNDVEEAKRNAPSWFAFFRWPEGAGAIAIILTLLAIAEQTTATRKAAEAGLSQIQMTKAKERPWIQVAIEDRRGGVFFDIKAVNRGNTPAAIVSRTKYLRTLDFKEYLPKNPKFEEAEVFAEPQIVLPGDSYILYSLMSTDDAIGAMPGSDKHQQFMEMGIDFYIFGNVIYRDVLGGNETKSCETRWCYQVYPGDQPFKVLFFSHDREGYVRHT